MPTALSRRNGAGRATMAGVAAGRDGGRRSGTGPGPRRSGRERRAEARRQAEQRRAGAGDRRGLSPVMVAMAVGALVALLVGIALASGFLTPPGGSSGPSKTPAASLRTVLRSAATADVTIAGGSGWVLDDVAGTIRRFDPSSGAFSGSAHHVAERPVSVAAGFGKLWVADAVGNAVVVVDQRTGRALGAPISVAAEPVSVAAGEGGVWVASLGGSTLSLVDPRSRTVTASVALPDGAVRVAVGDGAVWVSGETDTLTKVSPRPEGVSLSWKAVRVGQGPIGIATAPGAVWVADAVSGTVSRVDPKRLRVTGTYAIGPGGTVAGQVTERAAATGRSGSDPLTLAWFDGLVWIGDGRAGTVTALDPATGRQHDAPVALPGAPRRLVVADGSLWAATANPARVLQVDPR